MTTLNKQTNLLFFLYLLPGLLFLPFTFKKASAQATNRFDFNYQTFGVVDNISLSGVSGYAGHQFFLDEEGSSLLTTGLRFSKVELNDEEQTGSDHNRDLQTIVADLSLMRILNEKYSLILSLRPGVYGELSESFSNSFRLEGGFVVTRFMSDNLTLGLGLGRGTNFGRDLVVPLVQFLYFATDKIVVRGILPVRASVWYIPNQKWEFGFVYRLEGSLYELDQTNIAGAQKLGLAAAHVGLGTRYKLFNNNFLALEAGTSILRRYEWTKDRGTSMDIGQEPFKEREINNAPYLRLGWLQKF